MSRSSWRWVLPATIAALFTIGALTAAVWMTRDRGATGDDPHEIVLHSSAVRPRVRVRLGHPVGRPIPAGYLGLSVEFQAIRSYTGPDPHAINPLLVQLIRNLAPGQAPVIRIGGDSTDTSWVPGPGVKPPPPGSYELTPSWFATTEALTRAVGARLIVGVNLVANQRALAAAEGRADQRAFGSALEAFEIGNEPNVYNKIAAYHSYSGKNVLARPHSFGYPEYKREFDAIAAGLPPRPLAGPALAAGPTPTPGSWANTLPGFMAANRRLSILTIHRYPLRNCYVGPSSPQYPSVPDLLSGYSTTSLAAGVRRYVELAHAAGRELRIDELNSVACRGKQGVSDTFASGLWVVDALFALARAGVDGVNLHTLPNSAYELFSFTHKHGRWRASVAPVYYGLDLFARAAPPNSRLLRVRSAGPRHGVEVWATRDPGGQVRAVIDNESRSRSETVGLRPPAGTAGTATVLWMRAPSVYSKRGETIGGAAFDPKTGTLDGPQVMRLVPDHGRYALAVPAGSAALVSFPRSR